MFKCESNLATLLHFLCSLLRCRPALVQEIFTVLKMQLPHLINRCSYVIEQLIQRMKECSMRVLPLGELDAEARASMTQGSPAL